MATGIGLALAYGDFVDNATRTVIAGAVVVAYALLRTLAPVRGTEGRGPVLAIIVEHAIHVAVVAATGAWSSPFTFSLIASVIVAGFSRGFGFSLVMCTASVIVIEAVDITTDGTARIAVQWIVELYLVAIVAGYARRISGEKAHEQSLALDRIGRLADANALLSSLHRVAQTLPASLDLDEVLDSTMGRITDLFEFSAVALLVLDDTDGRWLVARREGTRLPRRIATDQLPPPLRRALVVRGLVHESNLLSSGGPGLAPRLSSGLYAVLPARGSIIGLVSIEHESADHFTPRDLELMRGFIEPAALAVDNARWFSRLRTVGAEEERNRIARDLHDRIGQSLAYLAFELDRIVKSARRGDELLVPLEDLRSDVRTVIREVRDTLYDLRTDVSDDQGFVATLELFLGRVRERTDIRMTVRSVESARLPVPQERELFRIAQEAITNVERHSEAGNVTITWQCDGRAAHLEVADDGRGFPVGRAGRLDSYGLLGMRERASSIGAFFEVQSEPGHGTRIRCRLG